MNATLVLHLCLALLAPAIRGTLPVSSGAPVAPAWMHFTPGASPGSLMLQRLEWLRAPQEKRAPSTPAATVQRGCSNPYTVRTGDTLAAIARRCGVSVTNLRRWNGLRSTWIFIGQRLITRSWQTPFAQPPAKPAPRIAPQPAPTPYMEPRIKP